ncbi:hypothetical protein HED54_14780 [Ochrobactrum anthropi ATCC 49188]|nr:hypothetical protein [Brucella anthropi ATCC 49188]
MKSYEWQFIAHVHIGIPAEGMMPRQEALANARLIAAAPELYEAANVALSRLQLTGGKDGEYLGNHEKKMIEVLSKALAKARGETHPSGGDRHGE